MARWQPSTSSVSDSELIGRRLFDEDGLAGADDQPVISPQWCLNSFQDNRNKEWSVDRMGRANCEKKVVNYLTLRAIKHANAFEKAKTFNGWFCVAAKHIRASKDYDLDVVPSPKQGMNENESSESDLTANSFHAHVVLPDNVPPIGCALYLRHIFQMNGQLHLLNQET